MLNRCIAICPAVKWVTRTYIDDIFAQQAKSRGYVASVKWCERCTKLTAIVDCIVIIIFSHYTDIYDLWMLHWSIQSDNINDKSIMQYSLLCRQLLLWKNVQTFFTSLFSVSASLLLPLHCCTPCSIYLWSQFFIEKSYIILSHFFEKNMADEDHICFSVCTSKPFPSSLHDKSNK